MSHSFARALRRATVVATAVSLAVLGAVVPASGSTDLIVNGSFEEPVVTSPHGYEIRTDVPGWTHAPARPGVTSSGIELQDVASRRAPGGGDQFAELDSDGPSTITQQVPTEVGRLYRLSFLWSPRDGQGAAQNHFTVAAGGEVLELGPTAGAPTVDWRPAALEFVATAATTAVQFTDLGPEESFGGYGAYIDLVSMVVVNRPPDCAGVAPDPASLWPPNHTMRSVGLSGGVDPDGDAVTTTVTGVLQDEPVDGAGDGATSPDAALADGGGLLLRAERSGDGDGRVYQVAYAVTDGGGLSCTGTVAVTVPRSRDGAPAVDSGAVHSSFG